MSTEETSLAILSRASEMLAKANTIQEAKELMDIALTAADWAHRKGLGKEAENHCRSYAVRAEIKMGGMLKVTKPKRAKGTRGKGRPKKGSTHKIEPKPDEPTLKELGLSWKEASEAQALAGLTEERQSDVIQGKVSPTAAMREAKREKATKAAPPLPTDKFRVLYADPPWKYGDQLTEKYGAVRFHYPSLTISELCALPIADLATENAVLFLWVTSPILSECFAVIKSWMFEYKSSFVWDKIKHNMGHYNSVRHELLLICTRGSCLPDVPTLIDSVQSIERTQHSVKPEAFRTIIDQLYTHGRKLELFSRGESVPGWDRWGNDAG